MTIEQVLTIVATVLGASGLFKGVEVYIRRRSPNDPQGPAPGGTLTSPGIITEAYCKETRKEMMEGVKERDTRIEDALGKLTDKVDDLGKKFAAVEGTAIKVANRSVGDHESRFHKPKSTGTYRRPGDSR